MSLSPDQMRAEIAALEAELSRDSRFKKLTLLRELLPLYDQGEAATESTAPISPAPAPETPYPWIAKALAETTKEDAIIAASRELIPHDGSVHRSVLLRYLQDAGIMGTEKNPMGYIAKFMAEHRDIFVSDGKGNVSMPRIEIPRFESKTPDEDQSSDGPKPNGKSSEVLSIEEAWERQHGRRFPVD